jgi:hypothetical protein
MTTSSQHPAGLPYLIRAGEAKAAATLTAIVLGTIVIVGTIPDVVIKHKEVYWAMFGR